MGKCVVSGGNESSGSREVIGNIGEVMKVVRKVSRIEVGGVMREVR